MKLLYVTPVGKKIELPDRSTTDGHNVIDLDPIRRQIATSLKVAFPNDTIIEASSVPNIASDFSSETIKQYDVLIADLSATHPSVLFGAGLAEAVGRPVIYLISNESPVPAILTSRRFLTYSKQSTSRDFLEELQRQVALARDNPKTFLQKPAKAKAPKAFISYCHKDRPYLDRLLVHLKPLSKAGTVDAWADTRIKTGDRWKESIQEALDSASIAILMISADFLASDFIVDNELPPLLSKAQVNGTRIMPLLLSPSRFSRERTLNIYQSINSPSEPLSLMPNDAREVIYDKLAQEIEAAVSHKASETD